MVLVDANGNGNFFRAVCFSNNGKGTAVAFRSVFTYRSTQYINSNVMAICADVNTAACAVCGSVIVYRATDHSIVAVIDGNTTSVIGCSIVDYATSGNFYITTVNISCTTAVICGV